MAFDNDKLFILKQQIARKSELDDILRSLNSERYTVRNNVIKLEDVLKNAQMREKELEKGGFSSILHRVSGKLEQKREAAHKEARQAKSDYDAAVRRLNEIDDGISRAQEEFKGVYNCEREYFTAFHEKLAAVKESNHPDKQGIIAQDEKLAMINTQMTELKGAITEGDNIRMLADRIISLKDNAPNVDISDVMFRNSFSVLGDVIDRRDMHNEANKLTGDLFGQLDRYKSTLIKVSSFAKDYADISFFTVFIEWINKTINNKNQFYMENVVRQIKEFIKKLDVVVDIIDNKHREVKIKLDELVLQIRL